MKKMTAWRISSGHFFRAVPACMAIPDGFFRRPPVGLRIARDPGR
jgi:hypothetical protein